MSWSETLPHDGISVTDISVCLIFFICILILIYTIFPLSSLFRPAEDYAIYEYFAEADSRDINPYCVPANYSSVLIQRFLVFSPIESSFGVIQQKYADYPPLLMKINSLVFRLDKILGLYLLYVFLYAFSIVLYLVYSNSKKSEIHFSEINAILFLMFFGLNPVFYIGWFIPITDKIWFPFFTLLLLIFRNKPYWIAITLGLFTAVKGIGIFIIVFYLIYQVINKNLQPRQIFYLIFIFGMILALSHLFWFPDWINGYQWRAERQTFVYHISLFIFLYKSGAYWGGMPIVLTSLSFLLLGWCIFKHFITLDEIITLPIVFSIIFNTDITYDRLLVAIFVMTLLARHNIIILISYVFGLFMVKYIGLDSWFALWGWTFFLLSVVCWQVFVRNRKGRAATQTAVFPPFAFLKHNQGI